MTPHASKAAVRELTTLIAQITPGEPIAAGGDILIPLFANRKGPNALLLEEGIDSRQTVINEIDTGGDVNQVRVQHRGPKSLLLLAGEQILGAKQNRVLNASFLIPPESDTTVPVSCVEQGRWRYDSGEFRAGRSTLHAGARSKKIHRVACALAAGDGYDANQDEVWRDVDSFLQETGVHSRTAAYEDGVASRRPQVERATEMLKAQPGQVGMALIRGGRVCLIDVFGSSRLFKRAVAKLARGIFAGLPAPQSQVRDVVAPLRNALAALQQASGQRTKAPGLGHTLHGFAGNLAFAALAHEGEIYHATVGAPEGN